MNYESTYQVTTPSGLFQAIFGEENTPVKFIGNADAIEAFRLWLADAMPCRPEGYLITMDSLEPDDLYKFCQPTGSGITVIPPLDDLIAYAQEERELDQQETNETALDSANTQESNKVATVTGIEKLKLTKELRGIRAGLALAANGIEKLKMIKRVKEIRAVFGGKVQEVEPVVEAEEINPGLSQEEIDYYEQNRSADPETDELNVTRTIDNMLANVKTYFTSANPLPELIPSDWIIMNTTRPLVGTKTFANEAYLHGRFYAAIDPNDEFALQYIKTDIGLDGYVIKLIGNSLLFKMVKNTIPEKYLEALGKLPIDKQNQYMLDKKESINGKPYSEAMIMMENAYDKHEAENTPVPIPEDSNPVVAEESEEPSVVGNPIEEQEPETASVENLVQPITGNTELDKQKRKLQSLTDLQERMKLGNKIIKSKTLTDDQKKAKLMDSGFTEGQFYELMKPDFAGRIGFADYMLTNNNATIRNTAKRIAQLEAQDLAAAKASSGDSATSYDFDGGSIDLDYADDRLKVNFDSKPASDMRDKLKQNGFNWSPTNGTWQRKLTDNAISTANYLFGTKIQTAASAMQEEVNKPSENGIVASVVNANIEAEVFNELKHLGWITGKYDGGLASLEKGAFSVVTMASKTKDGGIGFVCEVSLSNGVDAGSLNVHIPTIEVQSGDTASIVAEKIDNIVNDAIKSPVFLAYAKRYEVVINETPVSQENPMQAAFAAELESLKMERDIDTYDKRLDEIYARIEKAGLAEELDGILQATADVLTGLLAEAEKKGS